MKRGVFLVAVLAACSSSEREPDPPPAPTAPGPNPAAVAPAIDAAPPAIDAAAPDNAAADAMPAKETAAKTRADFEREATAYLDVLVAEGDTSTLDFTDRGAELPGAVKEAAEVDRKVEGRITVGAVTSDAMDFEAAARRTIPRFTRGIQACYRRSLKRDPALTGRLDLRLAVNAAGRVIAADVKGFEEQVVACVRSQTRGWRFPAPSATPPVHVRVSFECKPL